tara:strand:+ start:816 stop:932 length:117 start_codon:yes stop_codon:yes gene_type:complete
LNKKGNWFFETGLGFWIIGCDCFYTEACCTDFANFLAP